MTNEPPTLTRMGEDGIEPLAFFAALCGKDRHLPLDEYQSPQILKLIDRAAFAREVEQFQQTHCGLFIATVYEPAALEILEHAKNFPDRPLRLDRFVFAHGALYSTLDYNGA